MPVYGFPDRRSYNRMARAVRRVESLPGGQRPGRVREHGPNVRLARTSAAHAAGATQAVNLCDNDFVAFSPTRQVNATNDAEVSIPADTKLYIARFAGKTRIVQAFVCTE